MESGVLEHLSTLYHDTAAVDKNELETIQRFYQEYLIDVKQRTLTKGQELIAPKRDSERKPSQIPIAVATNTSATSASICQNVLLEGQTK